MKNIGVSGALGTLGLVLVSGLIGYIWLPSVARDPGQSFFAAWCSAFGVPGSWASSNAAVAANQSSEVVLRGDLLATAQRSDITHGAALAQRCTMCHGPTGKSFPGSPNLAGQFAVVVYKQLRDFKSGIRTNAMMMAMVTTLSDTDMRRLATYYASLPRPAEAQNTARAPDIVKWGAPMRNIAPCGTCHGDIEHTMASPWLKGAPEAYIRAQLTAFASGERRNDINGQMRAMARALSPPEIGQAAAYYSAGEK
jgi:cytochrome c553